MKELLLLLGAMAVALSIVAASVGPGGDTTILVSPPEAVAEEFVRKLATGRYDRAVERVDGGAKLSPRVERHGKALRARAGAVNHVEGVNGAIAGDHATASVRIRTADAGELQWRFSLVRRDGVWKIADWSAE